ncbi:DNA-binding protein [Candidatus Bathyarchaeota archaeon]|nr:DNA-binding protein [Candidatus Bathyarchaeota archaeon]
MANQPLRVLFDTNFLLIPIRFGVDVFDEAKRVLNGLPEFTVTPGVLEEIEHLKRGAKLSFQRELEFAARVAERCVVLDADKRDDESVDDSILRVAVEKGFIVGTTDAELRKRLRAAGVKVLVLRQKRYLEIDE